MSNFTAIIWMNRHHVAGAKLDRAKRNSRGGVDLSEAPERLPKMLRRRMHGHAVVAQIQAAGQPQLTKYCSSLFAGAGILLVVSIAYLIGLIPDTNRGGGAISDTTRGAAISSNFFSLPAVLTQHSPLRSKLCRIQSEPASVRADLFNALGVTCLTEGDTAGATECFRKAVVADPLLVAARNNLGAALVQCGDVSGARTAFTSTLELQPGNAYAARQLANLTKK